MLTSIRDHKKTTQSLVTAIIGRRKHSLPDDIRTIRRMTSDQLVAAGLTPSIANRLRCAVELAGQIAEPTVDYSSPIKSPNDCIQWITSNFRDLQSWGEQEEFWILTLSTKNTVINAHPVTVGTNRNSLVHPREVFKKAISDSATSIVCFHNHPSGDPTPSEQDIDVTKRLTEAGEIIGIPVLDHIVIARNGCISIQEWNSK